MMTKLMQRGAPWPAALVAIMLALPLVVTSAFAIDIHGEVRCRMIVIRSDRRESFEILQLRHQLVAGSINILRHNTADGIGVLTLGLVCCADVDL